MDILQESARSASALILSYFHKEAAVSRKTTHQNLVTKADTESQALIKKIIYKKLAERNIKKSEIGYIGEENLIVKGSKHLFIIDPLDGTNNFASGLDYFCVAIAHVQDDVLMDSIIYWPSQDTMYYATKGCGAWKQKGKNKPVRLQVKDELLENSMIFTYLSTNIEYRKKAYTFIENLFSTVRGIRIAGSLSLDLVHLCDTDNATHITLNFHGWLWDVVAGALIVQESGGILTDLKGNEIQVDCFDATKAYSFLAAHPNVITALKPFLKVEKK